MKSPWRRLFRLLDDVATIPRRDSVIWQGRISLLACVTFFGVFTARLLSPLQWIKWFARRRQRLSDTAGEQVRPDFHACWTELYFLLALPILLFLHHVLGASDGWISMLARVLGALFLLEIVVWMIYYGTLRGFIERTYSIYHRTEYLLMVPLAFTVCSAAYALMTGTTFSAAALMFLGGGSPTVIGQSVNVLLFVVVVSYLIAQFPAASVKSDATEAAKQHLTIIGAGDVVVNRALPALLNLGLRAQDMRLLAISDRPAGLATATLAPVMYQVVDEHAEATARIAMNSRDPILVATPTLSHVPLVQALAKLANKTLAPRQRLPLILEKPLCGPGQLSALRIALEAYGTTQLFALSYYQLEKALPLVFVLTANSGYLPYLYFSHADTSDTSGKWRSWKDFSWRRLKLGRLTSISGWLLEGTERSQVTGERLWLLDPKQGGVAYELMIHLLVLAHIALTNGARFSRGLVASADSRISWMHADTSLAPEVAQRAWPTGLHIATKADGCAIELRAGKYVSSTDTKRSMTLRYESGTIECDLDACTSTVFDSNNTQLFTVGIRNQFAGRYSVQMDLVHRFIDRGFWWWNRMDGLEAQLAALQWLESHVELQSV
ncbi:MAG TPA: hypothetical protein VFG60_06620 [Burkholderiaceae bacterium]|nr:hypothetical protein [Burkholderiaceae bacterium]